MILITHLSPEVVLKMTPEQSEIIIQEYIEMNNSEERSEKVDLSEMKGTPVEAKTLDAESAQRLKAEMEKIRNK